MYIVPCNYPNGVKDGKVCNDSGQCDCKPNFSGLKCERCATGFYDFENGCKGMNMIASYNLFATLDLFHNNHFQHSRLQLQQRCQGWKNM